MTGLGCATCGGLGFLRFDVCADGQCSDVEQVYAPCPDCAPVEPDGERGFDDFEASLPARLLAS